MKNPVLAALETITDGELEVLAVDFAAIEADMAGRDVGLFGGVWSVYVELCRMIRREQGARRGGARLVDTNTLWVLASRLDDAGVAATLAGLRAGRDSVTSSTVRAFIHATGSMVGLAAVQSRQPDAYANFSYN